MTASAKPRRIGKAPAFLSSTRAWREASRASSRCSGECTALGGVRLPCVAVCTEGRRASLAAHAPSATVQVR
eukprot:669871-Prymnesium_polylepis.1